MKTLMRKPMPAFGLLPRSIAALAIALIFFASSGANGDTAREDAPDEGKPHPGCGSYESPCIGNFAFHTTTRYQGEFVYCMTYGDVVKFNTFIQQDYKAARALPDLIHCYHADVVFEVMSLDPSLRAILPLFVENTKGAEHCPEGTGRCDLQIWIGNFFKAAFYTSGGNHTVAYLESARYGEVLDAQGNPIVEDGSKQ